MGPCVQRESKWDLQSSVFHKCLIYSYICICAHTAYSSKLHMYLIAYLNTAVRMPGLGGGRGTHRTKAGGGGLLDPGAGSQPRAEDTGSPFCTRRPQTPSQGLSLARPRPPRDGCVPHRVPAAARDPQDLLSPSSASDFPHFGECLPPSWPVAHSSFSGCVPSTHTHPHTHVQEPGGEGAEGQGFDPRLLGPENPALPVLPQF